MITKKRNSINPYAAKYADDDIVDRSTELEKLFETIRENKAYAHVFFSSSGIGKSSLTLKFLRKIDINRDGIPIRVKMSPKNDANTEEGTYLYSIFKELLQVIKQLRPKKWYNKLSFEYYITHCKDKALKRRLLENFIAPVFENDNIKNTLIRRFVFYFIKRLLRLGEFNYINILKENTLENRILISGYIKYVLCKKRAILNIDNLQNIDSHSFKFLLDWMNESKQQNTVFLLEYTLSEESSTEHMQYLLENIKETGIKARYTRVSNLDGADAIKAIRNTSDSPLSKCFEEAAKKYYYKSTNGNIRKLIDYQITYNGSNDDTENFDSTLENIKSLNKNEKQILAVLYVLDGRIELALLKNIIVPEFVYNYLEFEQLIKTLSERKKLICLKSSMVEIVHASILDAWEKSLNKDFIVYNKIACRRVSTILKDQFEKKDTTYYSIGQLLLHLMKLYTAYDFTQLYSLIISLDHNVLDSINAQDLLYFMKLLIEFTDRDVYSHGDLYEQIIKICYEYEMYAEGLIFIEQMELDESKPSKFVLYKLLLQTELSYSNEVIETIKLLNTKELAGTRTWLILNLLLIINYRKLNQKDKCLCIAEMVDKYDFSSVLEYGYYLRLKALYLPRDKGATFVEESINYFKENNCYIQVGKSQITLSFYLAISGRIDQAYNCITEAENNLSSTHVANHILENNKAAIDLLSSRYGNSVWECLERAELSATKAFDFLAITNNKLVWCIENKDYIKCDLLVNKIGRLLRHINDKHMHAFVNYNLYLLYKSRGMDVIAETFYNRAWELKEYCYTLKCRLLKIAPTDQTTFLISKPWHVCFLTYWCFDLY